MHVSVCNQRWPGAPGIYCLLFHKNNHGIPEKTLAGLYLCTLPYFSDGASAQYKNCKNLYNLCQHEADYGVKAEWNFFATSHGKSPCDGIGGTVKRLAARASLQATEARQILTPMQLYNWASSNVTGIIFFFVSADEVRRTTASVQKRLDAAATIPDTRSQHRFVRANQNSLHMYRLSYDHLHTTVSTCVEDLCDDSEDLNATVGCYVAAVYDEQWYVGMITERSHVHHDVVINFMTHNQRTNVFSWPQRKDECAVVLMYSASAFCHRKFSSTVQVTNRDGWHYHQEIWPVYVTEEVGSG